MWHQLQTTWRALRHRRDWERQLDDELRSHLEHRTAHLIQLGHSPEAAARQARLELGARETYREHCREAHGLRWPDELWQDLRYAVRTLRHAPGFTLVAVLSLMLGIGANTVVFSVLNSLVWKGLPAREPARLVALGRGGGSHTLSYPNYRDLRDRNATLSDLFACRIAAVGLAGNGASERIWGYLATGNYFDALGIQPHLGRLFHPADDRQPGASPYVVLSYASWQNRFAADPQIVGKQIRLNGFPSTILGVAPQGFYGTEFFYRPEFWIPLMQQKQVEGSSWLEERASMNIWVTGRLKSGVTAAQAAADLNTIAAALAKEYPRVNDGLKVHLTQPGLLGDALRRPMEAFMGGVMALAALVLLAACANLASLLSARASDRHRELAIRLSIGAGRARVVRQILTESLLLSVLGGAAGCALAACLLKALRDWRVPLAIPVQFEFSADLRVLSFAIIASLLTGILFGLAPARQIWRTDPQQALKAGTSTLTPGRRWALRDVLLAVQVALCCVLVCACLVSVRGLARAFETPVGFSAAGISLIGFDLRPAGYQREDGSRLQRRALEAASQIPGVVSAAYTDTVPLHLDQSDTTVFREDATDFRLKNGYNSSYYNVSPEYFRTMGTRLLFGRDFTWHDDQTSPPVAVVNETFARRVLGRGDAVGRHFRYGKNGPPVQVIGIVEDGKYESLVEDPHLALFRPAAQSFNDSTLLLVRCSLPESEIASQLRQLVSRLDSRLALHDIGSLTQLTGVAFFPARAATVALGAFGVLAIMLAVTGLYGLAAYTVSRRLREIGIRLAIGAKPADVLRHTLGRTAVLLTLGASLGLALGLAASHLLSVIVLQASARDPLVIAGVAFTMTLIGIASAWAPARRALAVDPARALREE